MLITLTAFMGKTGGSRTSQFKLCVMLYADGDNRSATVFAPCLEPQGQATM